MRPSTDAMRAFALAGALALALAALSGCGEYFDRRDTISLSAGNAIATDKVTQMVDPWPPASADKNIGFDGERMQHAVERYRTNRTYKPNGTGTGDTYGQAKAPDNTAPVGPTVTQQAAAPAK